MLTFSQIYVILIKNREEHPMTQTDIARDPLYIKRIKRVIQSQNRNVLIKNTIHDRPCDALVYILSGSCSYQFEDGRISTVSAGDILYLASQSVYTMYVLTKDYRFIFCDFEFVGDAPRKCAVYTPETPAEAEHRFRKLLHVYKTINARTFSQCICLLYEIYGIILKEENKTYLQSNMKEKLEAAKKFIDENYADPAFTVESLAKQTEMSVVYLRKQFKELYGMPPSRYLTAVRIKNATELMEYPFLSLEDCALQSGFASLQYFCRVFKKETNLTPAKFRNNL